MNNRTRAKVEIALQEGWAMYLRTSSAYAQAPSRSRDMQLQSIDQMITRSGLPMLYEYIDVETGTNTNRPDFQRMLADARRRKFSHLIVSHPDRFGRDAGEALTILNELHELGVKVCVATIPEVEDISSRRGRLHITIMFAIAENESSMTSERIKTVQREKIKAGEWCWKAPDGYLNIEEKIG